MGMEYQTAPTLLGRPIDAIDAEDILKIIAFPGPWTTPAAVFSQIGRTAVNNFRNRRSNNQTQTNSSTGGGTGGGIRGNNSNQVSSSGGSQGRVTLTTPAVTGRVSLPQDIITESIINRPVQVNQRRNTQGNRTLSRPRTSGQRNTQQNTVAPTQPTQTWRFTDRPINGNVVAESDKYKLINPKLTRNAGVESLEELTSRPVLDNKPGSEPVIYDRNYVRGQRFNNYSNVNSYLTWLGNNKDSDDYKLFMQNGYFDNNGNLDYGQIRTMLASQGIRGNLGRRDSRRLGNVLTRLREQSTVGTEAHDQFMRGAVEQFNANKQLYTPKDGKYAGRTFRDLRYDPTAKKGEEISFVGNDTNNMEGWFEPTNSSFQNYARNQHFTLPYLQSFIGRNPYGVSNPFFDMFGNLKLTFGGHRPTTNLDYVNGWWLPFTNKSINTPGFGGYNVATPPFFKF